jgi:hypothetical protein
MRNVSYQHTTICMPQSFIHIIVSVITWLVKWGVQASLHHYVQTLQPLYSNTECWTYQKHELAQISKLWFKHKMNTFTYRAEWLTAGHLPTAVVSFSHHDDPSITLSSAPGGTICAHWDGTMKSTSFASFTLIITQRALWHWLNR